jgi:hypothetical protein
MQSRDTICSKSSIDCRVDPWSFCWSFFAVSLVAHFSPKIVPLMTLSADFSIIQAAQSVTTIGFRILLTTSRNLGNSYDRPLFRISSKLFYSCQFTYLLSSPTFQKVLLSCVLQPPNLALPSSGNFATLTSWNSISRMHDNLF